MFESNKYDIISINVLLRNNCLPRTKKCFNKYQTLLPARVAGAAVHENNSQALPVTYTDYGKCILNIATVNITYIIGIDDDLEVSEYLFDLNGGQLETLGRVLGLSHATVTNCREHDVATYRKSLVTAWLNKQDNVMEKGAPSWTTLVSTLRSGHLRQNGIADKITREKLQNTK